MISCNYAVLGEILPREVREDDRFTAWQKCLPPVKKGKFHGKGPKLPINPFTGRPASIDSPITWGTLDEAVARAKEDHLAGIMIALVACDDLMGVDLDDCRNYITGEIEPWARKVIRTLNSYTEVSPSGTGVKILLRGDIELYGGNTPKCNPDFAKRIEVYKSRRFFTLTGQTVEIKDEDDQ